MREPHHAEEIRIPASGYAGCTPSPTPAVPDPMASAHTPMAPAHAIAPAAGPPGGICVVEPVRTPSHFLEGVCV